MSQTIFMIQCYFWKVRKHLFVSHLMLSVPLSPIMENLKMYDKISEKYFLDLILIKKGQHSISDKLVDINTFAKTSKYCMSDLSCPLTTDCTEPSLQIYINLKVFIFIVTQLKHWFSRPYTFSSESNLVVYNCKLFSLLAMLKSLTMYVTTNWKIKKEKEIQDHLTCLLKSLYGGQEATVRTRQGTTDWFKVGKGVSQHYVLLPCLFNLYVEYIM